jgi:hypothetical protein
MPTQTDMPEICGVTSLGRYLVTNRGDWDQFIFPGKEQYERFRNILKTIVDRHSEEIQRMGIDPERIGVHSIRKGSATYVCNGTASTVSFAAIKIYIVLF